MEVRNAVLGREVPDDYLRRQDSDYEEGISSEALSRCTSPSLEPLMCLPPPCLLWEEVNELLLDGQAAVDLMQDDCVSGTYLLRNKGTDAPVAVIKPCNAEVATAGNPKGNVEEQKDGFVPGRGYLREVFAYELDRDGFAGVPETTVSYLPEALFGGAGQGTVACSVQRYAENDGQSWDCGPIKFSAADTRRIGLLDLRLLNCDRHGGNILLQKGDSTSTTRLVPIDHGFTLPTDISNLDFEWQLWPQSKTPFTEEELQYVQHIDIDRDCAAALRMGIEPEAVEYFRAASICLKTACRMGLTLFEISCFYRRQRINEPSGLELFVAECRRSLDDPIVPGCVDFALLIDLAEEVLAAGCKDFN